MARIVVVALLILASDGGPHGAAAQDQSPAKGVAGIYLCEGQNPDGTAYKGIVEIVRFHDTFLVRWTLPEDVTVIGVGIQSSGVFAVSYFGGAPGVIVYRTEGDRLIGQWTMGGTNGGVFSETLTPVDIIPGSVQPPHVAPEPGAPRRPAAPPARGVRL